MVRRSKLAKDPGVSEFLYHGWPIPSRGVAMIAAAAKRRAGASAGRSICCWKAGRWAAAPAAAKRREAALGPWRAGDQGSFALGGATRGVEGFEGLVQGPQ